MGWDFLLFIAAALVGAGLLAVGYIAGRTSKKNDDYRSL